MPLEHARWLVVLVAAATARCVEPTQYGGPIAVEPIGFIDRYQRIGSRGRVPGEAADAAEPQGGSEHERAPQAPDAGKAGTADN